jgi:HK97 family phage major capsid protein
MTLAEKILAMKEKRANLTVQIRSILDEHEGKDYAQEKLDERNKLEKEFDSLTSKIESEERQHERERMTGELQARKLDDKGGEENTDEKRNAKLMGEFRKLLSERPNEYRALQMTNPTQAGFIVSPQEFSAEIIKDLDNILFMRQLATKKVLTGAHSLGFPKRTARASTFAWGTEIAAPTEDSALAYGKKEFKPNPGTGLIKISRPLLRNSPNADQEARAELSYDAGVNLEQAYMTGSGASKPLGVFTASVDGISTLRDVSTGNTATEMKFDGLMGAKYAIKEQYQNNLQWAFHRNGVLQIAKLKDSDGQYIWRENVRAGEPSLLLGLPVRMSEYAPSTFTTGLYVGVLGNFTYYWIVDSLNMEIQILNELYAATNQVGMIYRLETDGMPVDENAFARVKLG